MKKRLTLGAAAVALVLLPAVPANAQTGTGTATCNTTWSYTWANSTQSIKHAHSAYVYREMVAGPGTWGYRAIFMPGVVNMSLSTTGNYSGAVFGCSA